MAASTAIVEVLGLPVRRLAELPLPTTLTACVVGLEVALHLTTSRAAATALERTGALHLTPLEYEGLAVALADGRLTRDDALRLLRAKADGRTGRLTHARLLGPVTRPDGGGAAWTFAELLEALGGDLVDVAIEGEARPEGSAAA